MKSTVDEIRRRFDQDVERFSNLETGQSATVDAPLVLDLIAQAAAVCNPRATHALDVGCGAGNYALKLLQLLPQLSIDLVDLSEPMLSRARERIAATGRTGVNGVITYQADIRDLALESERYDIIIAAAALHHLRTDEEWEHVFAKFHAALKPGGSVWISDMVEHSITEVHALMWQRYGEYLQDLRDAAYRDDVFTYIDQEDTPRPLMYQLELLRTVGFRAVDVLHKNSNFAAFGGVK